MQKLLLALLASAAVAAPAHATTYQFTIRLLDGLGHPQPSYAFQIDSAPTPDSYVATPGFSYFEIDNVKLTSDPSYPTPPASPVDLLFFDQDTGGVFSTADFFTLSYFGYQLFDGTVAAPIFKVGTTPIFGALDGTSGTITISQVPEPASWALMIGGLGAIGVALRRRRIALAA